MPDSHAVKPVSYASFDAAQYFPALDGIRALSVLLVLFDHSHSDVPSWIRGGRGVDVFFVLSGFLITTLLLRERARTGRVSLGAFYTRRVFRIVPVYFATILLYFLAVHVAHDTARIQQYEAALPWLLTFMREYAPVSAGNILGHAWTLAIEEKFYLCWPVLMIWLYPFRGRQALGLLLISAAIVAFPTEYARSYGGLFIGVILAIGLNPSTRAVTTIRIALMRDWIVLIALLASYALTLLNEYFVFLFDGVIALLIASLVLRQGSVRHFLESRLLVFIGKRSYGMYLLHVLAVNVVVSAWPAVLPRNWITVAAAAAAAALFAASLSYAALERPLIILGSRLAAPQSDRSISKATT